MLRLQRLIGNQAVCRLFGGGAPQPKLHVGPVGDRYEQEADQVAAEVMRSLASPVTPDDEELRVRRSPAEEVVDLGGSAVAADTESDIRRVPRSGSRPALPRSPDGCIQRDIDRDTFVRKLGRERTLEVSLAELLEMELYRILITQIDKYNRQPSRTRLNSVKSALASLESILTMDFLNAYSYLKRQIAYEETRISSPKSQSKEKEPPLGGFGGLGASNAPPLREGPKPGDRRFMPDDDEELEEKSHSFRPSFAEPSWRREKPTLPLREEKSQVAEAKPHSEKKKRSKEKSDVPRQGTRISSPKSQSKEKEPPLGGFGGFGASNAPSLREGPKPGDRRFMPDDDEELEEKAHSFRPSLAEPSWKREKPTLPLREEKSQVAEAEPHSEKKKRSKGKSIVPYEEAVAARFRDESGPIFQKLWRTASPEQKERIQALFSVKRRHANLSGLEYALEALDPQHRLEHRGGLGEAGRAWAKDDTDLYFFTWLEKTGNRYKGEMDRVEYFDEEQRKDYKLNLGPTIKYVKTERALEDDNIYAVSQSDEFYASDRSISDKGLVHHSSFLAGQAVKAAGHIVFKSPGKLSKINLSSGHYMPKPEHMKNALRILKRARVNLDEVTAHPDEGGGEGFNAQKWLDTHG